jgi:hypothetical protein
MAVEIDCPICDAPIPLDNNERPTKDKGLMLIEEFEE